MPPQFDPIPVTMGGEDDCPESFAVCLSAEGAVTLGDAVMELVEYGMNAWTLCGGHATDASPPPNGTPSN